MDMILSQVDLFEEAPFTIQRVCELLIDPKKHYKSTDKYMRALLKNLLVVSGMFLK
jgi:serine/threonine-protein phosphatase 4 regulatory subunit 2